MSKELKERLANEAITIGLIGAIGSGKSTLASVLAERLGITRVEEKFPQNPFLEDFYQNPREFSFRSQLWFLKSTTDQMLSATSELKNKSAILDPANEMNYIYAKTHHSLGWMTDREFDLYKSVYEVLTSRGRVKKPDLTLWLAPPDEVLTGRIKARARPYELLMLKHFPLYLFQLNANVMSYAEANRGNFIFVDSREDFKKELVLTNLMEKIKRNI